MHLFTKLSQNVYLPFNTELNMGTVCWRRKDDKWNMAQKEAAPVFSSNEMYMSHVRAVKTKFPLYYDGLTAI